MILGYEEPVLMPTMDIYSTDLMKMYITGVKVLSEKGLDEYKDFMKQYQDFYGSLPGANEYWYNNTVKPALDLIAQASAQGIDLFKSPEGRAALRNMMNNVPIGKLKQVQAASENYDKYLDSIAKLDELGKYDKGFQDFILNQMFPGGYKLQDANGNINPWNLRNATPYLDMTEATAPWFEGMKDTFLGTTPDGRYNLMGIDETSMQPILDQNMSDYLSSPLGQYHFKQFANSLPPGTTPEQAFGAFKNEIMAKNRRIQHVERKEDPYTMDSFRTANNIMADRKRQALLHYYHDLENPTKPNGGEYSHYSAIEQSSGGIVEKLSGIKYKVDPKTGLGSYWAVGSDGKEFEVSEKDAQKLAISSANRKIGNKTHVFDVLASEDVSALGESMMANAADAEGIVDWKKLKSKIYSLNSLDRRSGHGDLENQNELTTEEIRRLVVDRQEVTHNGITYKPITKEEKQKNGTTISIEETPYQKGKSAAIWMDRGIQGVYTEFSIPVDVDGKTQYVRMVLKGGEYEIDTMSGQKVPTDRWKPFMYAIDKNVSGNVMGESTGVKIKNIEKQ